MRCVMPCCDSLDSRARVPACHLQLKDVLYIHVYFPDVKSTRLVTLLEDKENIMPHYTYLIIGGGMTADAAVHGIRQRDAHSAIGLISAESDPPYDRPPLSKGLWQGAPLEKIWRRTTDQGVTLHLGRTARTLDPNTKQVIDDQHTIYTFDKLLLATGGTPRRLRGDNERIVYFRTLEDYRRLRVLTETGQRFGVIGGGFIGAEMAAALAMNSKEVVMIFPGETIGGRIFPHDVGVFLNDLYRQKGVQVLAGERMTGIETRGAPLVVHTSGGQALLVDGIVAGPGIEPNIELAQTSGLTVNNGIVVNAYLRTSHPDIYAAGDVAAFEQTPLGKRIRVEHEDNANSMGRHAGRNMAGMDEPYHHLPFFYSDLFDIGYEAVGELDARLDTVTDWREPYREGVIYYLETGRVRGVLLWNIWGHIEAARELIKAPGPFTATDLNGRLSD
jgi:3-phenylpropionate/trans-cinnamate dioxygenase ferredoxin reductase subunit